jgi:hypothetical protein
MDQEQQKRGDREQEKLNDRFAGTHDGFPLRDLYCYPARRFM